MSLKHPQLLCSLSFELKTLISEFEPEFTHLTKSLCNEKITRSSKPLFGNLSFSKWSLFPIKNRLLIKNTEVKETLGPFDYVTSENDNEVHWYPNFADYYLFGFYSGPLLAQDELQVLEHPSLGSLRQALIHDTSLPKNATPLTRKNGVPTPVLIYNVPRQAILDIAPNKEKGRPFGLYGNQFARTNRKVVLDAVSILNPPTWSNIYAMEAPKYGLGKYTLSQIKEIFSSCYTSFSAAKLVSQEEENFGFDQTLYILENSNQKETEKEKTENEKEEKKEKEMENEVEKENGKKKKEPIEENIENEKENVNDKEKEKEKTMEENKENEKEILDFVEIPRVRKVPRKVILHLGHWGCGAYGGNKVLMTLLQLLAAKAAGADNVYYHTFTKIGSESFSKGVESFENLLQEVIEKENLLNIEKTLKKIEEMNFEWGESDRN
ncbi:poly adp-ribose glycohydrolase [Anaeramoeba flamelloides]|uniref:Poly adp-ribose glycohydrolase n=1 Tax=Anaeramoeba flamelloides TaxID=1746091 RepID=A0ABQ8XDM9_9EUKA|nr:poly adp-ribose glycohydrolase [Anaeramoeba flamelloides]